MKKLSTKSCISRDTSNVVVNEINSAWVQCKGRPQDYQAYIKLGWADYKTELLWLYFFIYIFYLSERKQENGVSFI